MISNNPKNEISFLKKKFKDISYKRITKSNLHSEQISNHVAILAKNKNGFRVLKPNSVYFIDANDPNRTKWDMTSIDADNLKWSKGTGSSGLFDEVFQAKDIYDNLLSEEVINYMKNNGFVTYDILQGFYRPLDNALGQVDIVFVKDEGRFRKDHRYASKNQLKK